MPCSAGRNSAAWRSREISQAFHGAWLTRARSTWIGLHVLGTTFGWDDMLAYVLAAGAAFAVDAWAGAPRAGTGDRDLTDRR